MPDLKRLAPGELLKLHADISEELRDRGVVRTSNNPTGDLAGLNLVRLAPPIAGGISDRLSDTGDILKLIEESDVRNQYGYDTGAARKPSEKGG